MININKKLWLSPIIEKSALEGFQPCFPPLPKNIRLSPAESLPAWLFYLPGFFWWVCLAIYYRSWTLPCLVNPSISLGGMVNETKSSIYEQFQTTPLKQYVPIFCRLHNDGLNKEELQQAVKETGLTFPIIAKPDIGCKGFGVKLLTDMEMLIDYARDYPHDECFLICEFADYPEEIGIFYVRSPETGEFSVPSLTLKYPFLLSGDGTQTIRELLHANAATKRLLHRCEMRYGKMLDDVLPEDSYFRATAVGSHTSGTIFRDGEALIDDALVAQLDRLTQDIPNFYYGRIDIKCRSLDDFKQGKNFKIIEFNGAGAEMTHIWDPEGSLWRAWVGIFLQISLLFKIGHQVRRQQTYKKPSSLSLWRAFRAESKRNRIYTVSS